ncbi:MAG: DUF4230 domain-containing protein [Anaerococcus sp.]
MKNKIKIVILSFLFIFSFSGCVEKKVEAKEPDIGEVRNICNLATLESYYNNVAKSVKPAGEGLAHIGENDRTFWIEYTGVAKLGIDMSAVEMSVNGTNIDISLPAAKVLNISIDKDSLNEDSYIISKDGLNSNKISGKDQTLAIKKAQEDMEKTIMANQPLLLNAQSRAKKLIGNYIEQLGRAQGIEYSIQWELEGINDIENEKVVES